MEGEELWYFQCKRSKKISPAIFKAEVDKFNRLAAADPAKQPAGVVFITNAKVSARVRDEVSAYCRESGYACDFWAHTELDLRVKRHPAIVAEFFGAAYVHTAPALHQIPPPPHDFIRRSVELAHLISAIEQGESHLLSLYGMGGGGKTALALKLTEQLTSHYPAAHI